LHPLAKLPGQADVLLAVDTSTSQAGLALYDGRVRTELLWHAGRDHGRHLLPAIEEALRRIGIAPTDLTAVAAARGPGSFTGLRVGLAVAQGLALALQVPMFGVDSLTVLAHGLAGWSGPVQAVLEAGRGRFATARFEPASDGYRRQGEVMGMDVDSLLRLAVDGGTRRCAIVGDLDATIRSRLAELGEQVWVASPALAVRRPAVLAELAWRKLEQGQPPGPDDGEPIYLSRG
jgi:tRNA threonylcarbamoyladenosine biosynthesis protein TsaB